MTARSIARSSHGEPTCPFTVHCGQELFMRACFLGQNICVLGRGIAMLQSPPIVVEAPPKELGALPRQDGPPVQDYCAAKDTVPDQPGT
jgi:hypothetical protein